MNGLTQGAGNPVQNVKRSFLVMKQFWARNVRSAKVSLSAVFNAEKIIRQRRWKTEFVCLAGKRKASSMKIYWYRIMGSRKYHCFRRVSNVYPFEAVTACGRYIKRELIMIASGTTRIKSPKKCKFCKREGE